MEVEEVAKPTAKGKGRGKGKSAGGTKAASEEAPNHSYDKSQPISLGKISYFQHQYLIVYAFQSRLVTMFVIVTGLHIYSLGLKVI